MSIVASCFIPSSSFRVLYLEYRFLACAVEKQSFITSVYNNNDQTCSCADSSLLKVLQFKRKGGACYASVS